MSGEGLHAARMGVLDQHSALVGIGRGYCGRGSVGFKYRNLEFGIWNLVDLSIEAVDAYSFGDKQFGLWTDGCLCGILILFYKEMKAAESNTNSAELLFSCGLPFRSCLMRG
ncbi:hypothetical protein VNO78_18808 [Psophocarpus tetragonolobus]|uniref:Uncharacterized protein n=1 Tax=Psophocarpus tetragonolobus TaxID=3891 RepID=A0AAN9S6Z7_PSOTE